MQLAFDVVPGAAAKLLRHAALSGRAGVSRHKLRWDWQDTPDAALAAAGLALEQGGGTGQARLCTLPPPDVAWLPGLAPIHADFALPDRLETLASLTGDCGTFTLPVGDAVVTVALLRGRLRAGEAEQRLNRLTLEGPPAAVLDLAARLAADLPLLPARAALAELGRALAQGTPPRARRGGPPDLGAARTVEQGLVVAVGHLLEVLLHEAPRCRADAGPQGVHQMRVALRRLRSALKVFRPLADGAAVREFDAGLKALAQLLGPARDWDVFLDGLGREVAQALPGQPELAKLLRAGQGARLAAYAALRHALDGPQFRLLLLQGMRLVLLKDWSAAGPALAPETPLAEFAGSLLRRRWRRFRRKGDDFAALNDVGRHELRLDGKRLRYAGELFAGLWSRRRARRFLRRLAHLQDALGVANDTAVALGLVRGLPRPPAFAVGAVAGFAAARLQPARDAALESWENLRLTEPFWDVG